MHLRGGGEAQRHLSHLTPQSMSQDAPSSTSDAREEDASLATKDEDTIAAIVTGPSLAGAVAIIRLSGTDAIAIASRVFRTGRGGRFKFGWRPESHRVYYGTAVDGDGVIIDEVLFISMLSPRSYTSEDVIEIHCHGGGVCAQRVIRTVVEAGARPARPGEFTLRAFLNGRLDLSQAENVMQLIQARTPAAADSALCGLRDGVGQAVIELRGECLQLLGELEARLDFDDDMPKMNLEQLLNDVESLQRRIEDALRTSRQSTLLRQGLQIAIVGRPNVGKSSLLNTWTKTNRAIVTDIAGTTRDVLEAGLVVGGVPVTLLDTAGIRESVDVVEKLGVERSQAAAATADIVVMVIDAKEGWTAEDGTIFKSLWGDGAGSSTCAVKGLSLLVANKHDLVADFKPEGENKEKSKEILLPLLCRETFSGPMVKTSTRTREGLDDLEKAILKIAGAPHLASGGGGISWAVNERQGEALVRAHESLMRVTDSIRGKLPIDFWTIDLRSCIISLGEVTGDEVTEEILDNIFSRFCIGK